MGAKDLFLDGFKVSITTKYTEVVMKYFSILVCILFAFSSCMQPNKTKTIESVKVSPLTHEDSILIEQEERIEEHYRQITVPLEELIYKQNSFDYIPVNTRTIAWYKKCRKALLKVYDSCYSDPELTDNAKVDSLFADIENSYGIDEEEELSKFHGIPRQRTKKTIILFHVTEKTIMMLQQDSNFVKEQMAWEKLQIALENFYLTAEEIAYTGGTGNVVLCLIAMNAIYKNREVDLARMLSGKSSESKGIQVAKGKFLHSVDSIEVELRKSYSNGEWKIFKDIPQLLDKMHEARKPLVMALDDWITERKHYRGCADAITDLNYTLSGKR